MRTASLGLLLALTTVVNAHNEETHDGPIRVAGLASTRFFNSSDGTLIAATDHGPPDGIPVLMIPGYLHSEDVFYEQIASRELAEFRLVTTNLRGQGYSEKPIDISSYTFKLHSDDIHAVIEGFSLDHPVLAAWSLGNVVAINYLMEYGQETVRGLDLIGPLIAPNGTFADIFAQPAPVAIQATSDNATTALAGSEGFITGESGDAVTPEQRLILSSIVSSSPPFSRAANLGLPLNISYESVLSSLTIPVLIQAGSPDPLAIPGAFPLQQQLLKTQETHLYPDGYHIPFILKTQQFNRDLRHWLESKFHK